MLKYTELLRKRNFFLYCTALVFSQFGDRLLQIVLLGFVYKISPGSTLQLAKLLAFTIIPSFIVSPIAGVYVDRWNKKTVMISADLLRAALTLFIAMCLVTSDQPGFLYVVLFFLFSSACFYLPAKFSIIPDFVDESELLLANSAVSITAIVSGVAGFTLGGLMVEWLDLKWSVYVNSFVYFVSAACIFFIALKRKKSFPKEPIADLGREITRIFQKPFLYELKEGFKHFLLGRDIRFVLYINFILMAAVGAVYVVLVVFIQETLHTMTKHIGLFGLFMCLGLFLGSLLYGRIGQRFSKDKTIFFSLTSGGVFMGLFVVLLKLTGLFSVGAALIFLLGVAISPIMISANTIIHESIDEKLRGRIFSSMGIVMNVGMLLFMFAASVLAEFVGRMWILIFTSVVFSGCGIAGFVLNSKKASL